MLTPQELRDKTCPVCEGACEFDPWPGEPDQSTKPCHWCGGDGIDRETDEHGAYIEEEE